MYNNFKGRNPILKKAILSPCKEHFFTEKPAHPRICVQREPEGRYRKFMHFLKVCNQLLFVEPGYSYNDTISSICSQTIMNDPSLLVTLDSLSGRSWTELVSLTDMYMTFEDLCEILNYENISLYLIEASKGCRILFKLINFEFSIFNFCLI